MTLTQLLPDLLCTAILLLFLVVGAIRGMFRTLSGLLTWLVSLWGAKLAADRFAPLLVDWLTPKLLPTVTEKLTEAMGSAVSGSAASDGLGGLLGLIPGVQSLLHQAGDSLAEALAPAIAQEAALAVGWLIVFAAGFIVLKLLCKLLVWLLDLLDEVPGLHLLNHLGGAALGTLKGVLLLTIAINILLWCDVLPRSLVEETLLVSRLAALGPVY